MSPREHARPRGRAGRRRPAPVSQHHAEWLSLIEVSGPFLSLPALHRAFPQGIEPTGPETVAELRRNWTAWQDDPDALQGRWVRWVLGTLLDHGPEVLADGPAVPATLTHHAPEHAATLRPHLAVLDPASTEPRQARLLVTVWPPEQPLDAPVEGDRWTASPRERMAVLLRGTGVRLGLVTNGERWVLVHVARGQETGYVTWDAGIWLEERPALNAFTTLLGARRFFGAAERDTLEALLDESVNAQQEVTDQLGRQVRAAVEMLVDAFSRADRERGGQPLVEVDPRELYQGAVTTMMRLVFLLAAEERGLFLLEDELYATSYAVSTLRAQLEEDAYRLGSEETLESRCSAWQRLLATFRMVHGGVRHDRLLLPAYGGGLFDPSRFPFLEGRKTGVAAPAEPVPIDDRTVLHLLDALQILRRKGRGAGPAEAQRLSYRALDVEQIGHVYEGLLDHGAVKVDSPAVGLEGKLEPEIALSRLETAAAQGRETLLELLQEQTGESRKWVETRLDRPPPDRDQRTRLLVACDNYGALADRVAPYHGLLRRDLRGDPTVFLAGSTYVGRAGERRSTGTYYTPRALAEEVVRHTLDPIVYRPGPAEGTEQGEWKLRPSTELLKLKVCDLAMGSGAFLVAACRYLADRLVEAWAAEGATTAPAVNGDRVPLPTDVEERASVARRLVTDRCLYGVDKNPMAVEMAKLSLWLVTLAKDRPFSFLDHALRAGDSLLGLSSMDQLTNLHPDPQRGADVHLTLGTVVTEVVAEAVDHATRLRRRIGNMPVLEVRHAEEKERMLREAEGRTRDLRLAADAVVAATLATPGGGEKLDEKLLAVAPKVATALDPHAREGDRAVARSELHFQTLEWLVAGRPPGGEERHPFHWPLEFPEVLAEGGGFDAVVGNPPFQGGHKITGALGTDYREWLVHWLADGRRGKADLVAYFYLRANKLLDRMSGIGLLATGTIAQGDSREVGLDYLTASGWTITRAIKSRPWPGDAVLEISEIWLHRGIWSGKVFLDGNIVRGITPSIDPRGRVSGKPLRLRANSSIAFEGSKVGGTGFLLSNAERDRLTQVSSRNSEVLFPYLTGEDLNTSPTQVPSRWVINFFDWSLEQAETYPEVIAIVRDKVKPFRDRQGEVAAQRTWWRYFRTRPEMHRAIENYERTLVIAEVSKTVLPAFSPTGIVFSNKLRVFAYDDYAHFGLLSSAFHWWWAVTYSSTLRQDLNYAPTDCFETLPQPSLTPEVARAGKALDDHRRPLMIERQEGLTKIYNRLHNPEEHAADIAELRRLHVELDHAVAVAYGWDDLPMDHDFHDTRFGTRYTLSLPTRTELLDRLLELNHERAAAEAAAAASTPQPATGRGRGPGRGAGRKRQSGAGPEQTTLGGL